MSASGGILPPDDAVLLDRSRSGDAEALEQLFRRHLPWLCSLGELLDLPSGAAETAALEVFTRLWRDRDGPLPAAPSPRALLYGVVRAEALRLRTQTSNGGPPTGASLPQATPEPAEAGSGTRTRPPVRPDSDDAIARLRELPVLPRLAFALRTLHGLDDAEVAHVLGSPVAEVQAQCADAVAQLDRLAQAGSPDPSTAAQPPGAPPGVLLHRWHPRGRWDTDEAWIRLRARLRAQQRGGRMHRVWRTLRRRRDTLA